MYLESIYSSQKSFSKKAEVITEGAETKLKSYHTIVAVKQGKTIPIQDYANLIGYKGQNLTLEKIQEFAEDELDWTIWDYPLEEYEYALNEVHEGKAEELVIVETDFGIRVCEI